MSNITFNLRNAFKVEREEGYALVMLKRDGPETRAQILQIINSLVNGKFKAKFELEGKKVLRKCKFKGIMQLTLK